jgi:hypothetical protein
MYRLFILSDRFELYQRLTDIEQKTKLFIDIFIQYVYHNQIHILSLYLHKNIYVQGGKMLMINIQT